MAMDDTGGPGMEDNGWDGSLSPEEEAFLNDHGGDDELNYARWMLLSLAKRNGVSVDAVRGALLYAHIQREARRIAADAERLAGLAAYVTRADILPDETDYAGMSPEEFRRCERRLRESAQNPRG